MQVNGTAVSTYGFIVEDVTGIGPIEYDLSLQQLPGLTDQVALGRPRAKAREITVTGYFKAASLSTLKSYADSLRQLLDGRTERTLEFDEETTRYYNGRCLSPQEIRIAPAFTQKKRRMTLKFTCRDPRAWDASTTTVSGLHSGAQSIGLGTAAVREAVITITMSSTASNILLKVGSTEIGRIELSGLISGNVVTIDLRTQYVKIGSVSSPAVFTGGDFFELDPAAGSQTLEVSGASAASITYRKAYL